MTAHMVYALVLSGCYSTGFSTLHLIVMHLAVLLTLSIIMLSYSMQQHVILL
jgi:hypothetical protein